MGESVLKFLQAAPEGGFTANAASVYNGGTAVAAKRRFAVDDSSEFGYAELTWEAPEEARGTYPATNAHHLQMRMAKGKFGALVYADELIYYLLAAISGSPTVAPMPATANALLAATATATSNTVLTKQPNDASFGGALAQIIAVTLAKATADTTAVTFTIVGTDISGAALTETVAFPLGTTTPSKVGGGAGALSCTLYTKNYFATVTSFTASQAVATETVALGGVLAFLWTFIPDMGTSTLQSLTGEWFDGASPWQLPGMVLPKLDLDLAVGKSLKMKGDTLSKDMIPLASMTSLADAIWPALTSNGARYYSDPIGTAPGTTQIAARLVAGTFSIDNGLVLGKAADGTALPTFVGRKRYKTKAEITLLYNSNVAASEDPADFAAYQRTYLSRVVRIACLSTAYLPCGPVTLPTNWPASLADANAKGGLYGIAIDHAGKFTAGAPVNSEGRTAVKLTHDMETDYTKIGAPYQVLVVNRMNPNS